VHLTPRQGQIVALMAEGLSDKEIARRLRVSPATVRTHIDRLFADNGIHTRTEAVVAWMRDQVTREQRGAV
jgi:DNA-binding NarL/FixJ family response regulator